jgi:hypothetical protein
MSSDQLSNLFNGLVNSGTKSKSDYPVLSFTMKLDEELSLKWTRVCSIISTHGWRKNIGEPWSYKITFASMGDVAKFVTNYESLITREADKPNWYELSGSDKITWEFVLENIHERWNWHALSMNPIITIDIVLKHPEFPWYWKVISQNPNITINNVIKYSSVPWVWNELGYNPGIKLEDIMSYPNFPWNWATVSVRKDVNIEVVKKYRNAPWNWKWLTFNRNITSEDIINNDMPWRKCDGTEVDDLRVPFRY